MPTDHRAVLAKIKRFDQLIAYLRDEMGWPIARDSFEDVDDLFYDFSADELGIDPKTAAKIETIKRLRPLSPQQPWGIFFVKFQPGRLPVIALRRILSQVALKRRASANSAERAAWSVNDLLFVSNYGEGDERQISFAHFSQADAKRDLPTLKVLGWDNLDTALHLDAVAKELTENLAWPDDDADIGGWRNRWRAAFTLRHHEVVTTAKELSIRLAELARAIRDRIKTALAIETETGPLTKLMKAFQEALVHDLDANGFADMYAQTIAYGLLSARIADPEKKTADDFATHMRTNPFLRELMETFLKVGGRRGKAGGPGIDFDELGVSEVVELLDDANMEAVVRDFGDRNPQEDPVIHFYALFMAAYDKKQKIARGVFYTPRPVVSYIVRSVDELLRTELDLEDGLADISTWGEMARRHEGFAIPKGVSPEQAFVQILDPATGTGTFLVDVIDLIHKTLAAKWRAQSFGKKKIEALWNEYVPKHLLPRLHGYELLMAPYAIAHLKIGLKLYETGYRFGSDERARIYLTNALEPAHDFSGTFAFAIPALAHEAQAVNEIKRRQRFTVVIGNPPYSNFGKLNKVPFILALLEDYKRGLNEKKLNLDDDFIKFLRLSHYLLHQAGSGILGFITNNTYFDGITHRQMRHFLLSSMDRIRVLDLHGSAAKKETAPDGSPDENVFDIQQGVGVSLWSKLPAQITRTEVWHTELWGRRESKYHWLAHDAGTTSFTLIKENKPFNFFVPRDFDLTSEYDPYFRLPDVFNTVGGGITTDRDELFYSSDSDKLRERIHVFFSSHGLDEPFRTAFRVENSSSYPLLERRRNSRFDEKAIMRCLYRPFEKLWTYYGVGISSRPAWDVMKHMLAPKALGLLAMRQFEYEVAEPCYFFVARGLVDNRVFVSNRGRVSVFPLFKFGNEADAEPGLLSGSPRLNLRRQFLLALGTRLTAYAFASGEINIL